jgi:hypothetical protein
VPTETYKLCSYSCNLSRAVTRVGEWLQQIAHLNIFKHAGKIDSEPATIKSATIGQNSYTTRSKLLQRLLYVSF